MCRLFGFRSLIQSQVHTSLVGAKNALSIQSHNHPDGWGVAYYLQNCPHVVKSAQAAIDDAIFKRVSGIVSSETVVAHIRKTTIGGHNILNTHPFQYGNWIFAHNGNIANFSLKRREILKEVSPQFKRFILGDTDSELIFYFLLSSLNSHISLEDLFLDSDQLQLFLREGIEKLISIAGPPQKETSSLKGTYYTFILTNGKTMIGHQGGQPLYYSTYKKKCSERETCPHFSHACENPKDSGSLNHLLLSSEPLMGENIWVPLKQGEIIALDPSMNLNIYRESSSGKL